MLKFCKASQSLEYFVNFIISLANNKAEDGENDGCKESPAPLYFDMRCAFNLNTFGIFLILCRKHFN